LRAVQQIHGDLLAGADALFEVAPPGGEMIDGAADGVEIFADAGYGKLRAPAVVAQQPHGHRGPAGHVAAAEEQPRGHMVMVVSKDIRFHLDRIADNALDGKAARVDLRLNALDDDAFSSLHGFGHGFDSPSGSQGAARRRRCGSPSARWFRFYKP
jgi:hypothetical protein